MKISILIPSGILLAVYWTYYFLKDYRKGVPLTVPLAFTCLFIPKLNLLRVNRTYSTAGIRTDDILTLLLLIVALRDTETYKNRHIRWGIGFLAALSVSNLISMFAGRANGLDNAVLFSILSIGRKYEYFAFALIGIYLARKTKNAEKVMLEQVTWMSCFHALIGTLQVFRLVNVANSGVITNSEFKGFAVSTFNGYYEYGQFLCFAVVIFFCAFLRACREKSGRNMLFSGGMILISLVMIWLSKSRSSLIIGVSMIVLILLYTLVSFRKTISLPVKAGASAGMLLVVLAGVLLLSGTVKIGRFKVVNISGYADNLKESIENGDLREYANIVRDDEIKETKTVKKSIKDRSAAIRFNKWGAALDGFRQFPVFGYGTGVTHVIDGNYVKLLGESGLVGTLLWLTMYGYFMKVMWSKRKHIRTAGCAFWMMVSVLFSSVFIDMFEASKPMGMLWLAAGLVIGLDSCCQAEPGKAGLSAPETAGQAENMAEV